ncbi:MAG: class I SAM-dependent methyltransferase [Chloroflexi bacterium]|nr:class I SAM-dependent methyltransferase [Chloroflexota bacterium]MCI0728407.1 class I SAM-dependent methyltransferase [Chloroflexota bacterium]
MDSIQREEGRRLFGGDVVSYASYRPPYPDKVFALLQEEGGLYPGCHTLEVGAGPGLATSRLLELGADPMVIVEPDARFNHSLQQIGRSFNSTIKILNQTFESVALAPASFNLAVSATAFHWIDQSIGLRKIADVLHQGGVWAMWWNIFGDPGRPDPFYQAADEVLKPLTSSPSHDNNSNIHFALDKAARIADILSTGKMTPPRFEVIRWAITLNVAQLRGLYATFSPIQKQDVDSRKRILDALAAIVENEFGGLVEKPMVTAVYLARRKW